MSWVRSNGSIVSGRAGGFFGVTSVAFVFDSRHIFSDIGSRV
jgi:hypothetical protein